MDAPGFLNVSALSILNTESLMNDSGMSESTASNDESHANLSSQSPTNPLHFCDSFPHADQIKSFRQGSPIYDVAWYPLATPTQPAGYCFIASIRDAPVRLLDAGDGRVSQSLPRSMCTSLTKS
jgi:hypothetical protein